MAEILLSYGENRAKLEQIFGVSRQTVKSALKFRTNSALANKIRYTAVSQFGGVEQKDKK